MLRHVTLKNFVHFEEEQNIDFQKGSHFFIGPNNSGKTSVFEAIRRCLSISMNTSLSSSHDPSKESVVICMYDSVQDVNETIRDNAAELRNATGYQHNISNATLCQREEKGTIDHDREREDIRLNDQKSINYRSEQKGYIGSNQHDEEGNETRSEELKGKLLTSIISLPQEKPDDVPIYVKTAVYFGETEYKFGMDFIKENLSNKLVNKRINFVLDRNWYLLIQNMLLKSDNETCVETFVNKILEKVAKENKAEFQTQDLPVNKDTPCNKILEYHLDKHVVFTFPMRSIGFLQWSFSERINAEFKVDNRQNAQKCAEIVGWYIKWCGKSKSGENKAVVEKEKLYFERITDNCRLEFYMENKILKVSRKPHPNGHEHTEEIELLKVPEGIMEAKICSILLAVDCFSTIGLEDPERGMHPQMVERLRDLVLWEIENKVVLVTSHHPSFLAPWAISRICFFRFNEIKNTFRIIAGKRLTGSLLTSGNRREDGLQKNVFHQTLRIITGYHFSSLFFAERILFVEGETDYQFMSTLRRLLMKKNYFLNDDLGTSKLEKFRRFLASLQIMHLGGEGNKERINNLCKNLEIERYFLFDYDVLQQKHNERNSFVETFDINHEQADIENDVSLLEQYGIFVWKEGTIEQVLFAFINGHITTHKNGLCKVDHDDVRTCLEDNNVPIKKEVAETVQPLRKKWTLFKDKNTTNMNIENIVENVIRISEVEKKSDFRRWLDFLTKRVEETL